MELGRLAMASNAGVDMVVRGEGPAGVTPEALEGFRTYLLAVANRELDTDLAAKVGASDLVQETLLAALRDAPTCRGRTREDLRPWLKAILGHVLANTRRHFRGAAKRRVAAEVAA